MHHILHQFAVKNSKEKVFNAFCQPQGLNAWWPLESQGYPGINEMYRFYFGPEYDWKAKVIHVIPNKELTWQMTEAMEDWKETQLGFRLSEKDDVTSVSFFHNNWQQASDHFAITNFCWGQLLNGLKNYVERGIIVPFEKRN